MARRLAHPAHFARAFVQAESLGVADDRNHEAVRRLRRHAQMHGAKARDDVVFVVVMGVDLRKLSDRLDDPKDEKGQQRQLRPLFSGAGVEGGAQLLERHDVDLLDIGEMCDAARQLGHVLGDASAHADDLDRLDGFIGRSA